MNIAITSMSLDGHGIPVPVGLSELINRAGAWSTEAIPQLKDYRREVIRIEGRLVTVLTHYQQKEARTS